MNRKTITFLSCLVLTLIVNPFILFSQVPERNSTYGLVHTPKGNLHVLVLFIRNENDTTDWDSWKHDELPDFAKEENNDLLSSEIKDIGSKPNLSTWYSDMSLGKFQFTGDVFPETIPVETRIPGNDAQISRGAIAYINEHYPDFDWSKYDNRKNKPYWKTDNTNSEPDGRLDYVIMLHRKKGMNGYAGISGSNLKLKNKDKTYAIIDGYTSIGTNPSANSISDLFIHEFGHNLYMAPHLGHANGVVGKYFRGTFGWSMANADKRIFYTCNSWERWYMGWSEIKYDITSSLKDTVVEIDDYVSKGDVIRIQLPHSDQHLWIENHQKVNQFDRHRFMKNGFNKPHNEPLKGVYAYIENLSPSRDKIHNFSKSANGMRVLHPNGKYDLTYKDSVYKEKKWWGQKAYDFYTKQKNPIEGNSLVDVIFRDFNHDGKINYNNNGNHPRSRFNETRSVYSIDDSLNCAWSGEYLNFKQGDEISVNSNVLALPLRRYDDKKLSLEPVFLNGLCVKVLSIENGKARIRISYNNFNLTHNTRWSGQEIIFQKNKEITEIPELTIESNLVIAKSETPSVHQKVNNSYNRPTVFRAKDQTTVRIKDGGFLRIDPSSSFILEKGASLVIDKGGVVQFIGTSNLLVEDGATIVNNGKVLFSSSVTNGLPKGAFTKKIPQDVMGIEGLVKLYDADISNKAYLSVHTTLFQLGEEVTVAKSKKLIKRFNKAEPFSKNFVPKAYYDFYINGKMNSFSVRGRRFSYKGQFYKRKVLGL